MTILHLIIAWVAVFVGYLLWVRIRDNAATGKRWWDFSPFNFLVGALLLAFIAWISVTWFKPEPKFRSADEQIAFAAATRQPWIACEALWEKIDSVPEDIDAHFLLLQNHFLQQEADFTPPDPLAFAEEEEKLYTYYSDLSRSPVSQLHDIGHIMLADFLLLQRNPDYAGASLHLQSVDEPTTKYVNYLAGKIMLTALNSDLSEEHFYSEIRNKGYKKGAYEYLALLYYLHNNDSALRSIVYSGADNYISPDIRASVYFKEKDVLRFYGLKLGILFRGITTWGFVGGMAILGTWLFFLWNLTFISRISFGRLIVPVLIGGLLAMTSWWLYAFYKNQLGFWATGEILNDAVFSFAGIGVIEELVKLVPFLIILHFTNTIRKPVDYIIVASACGLGFAVFENFMYIANYGLDVIHSRALTSSVSHMACSGIAAYGFVLRRYRWPHRWWLIPLFFIFASLAHGFYDFWLFNDKVQAFAILTLFFFLSEILIYISFINNALNQSVTAEDDPKLLAFDSQRMTSILAGAFVLLFTFEYVAMAFVYGAKYSNASLVTSFLSGGYLVFFLSLRMAQIRIEPCVWNKVDFLSGILPSQMFARKEEE